MIQNQVQRHLKIEALYREILDLIGEDILDQISETTVRGKLDAILSMGKIEGRLTAYNDGYMFHASPDDDRLIDDWARIIASVTDVPRETKGES